MDGPFTATVEVAGPFVVEAKSYIIGSTDGKLVKSRNWLVVLIVLFIASAGILATRKKSNN